MAFIPMTHVKKAMSGAMKLGQRYMHVFDGLTSMCKGKYYMYFAGSCFASKGKE